MRTRRSPSFRPLRCLGPSFTAERSARASAEDRTRARPSLAAAVRSGHPLSRPRGSPRSGPRSSGARCRRRSHAGGGRRRRAAGPRAVPSSCRRPHEPQTRCAWSATGPTWNSWRPPGPWLWLTMPEILEDVERPVDGRRRRRRVDRAAALDELGTGDVTLDVRQDVQQHAPLRRPAQAPGAQSRRDLRPAIRCMRQHRALLALSSRHRRATPRATAAGRRGRTGRSCRSRG